MSMNNPFDAAREAAVADLQGTLDNAGDAPARSDVPENNGSASIPPFKVDEGDDSEASTPAAGEATAVADDPTPGAPPPTEVTEVPAPVPTSKEEQKAWTLKHRGKEVVISKESEVVELAQKGFDYQFKTAELQKEKGELQAQWARKEAALKQFLQSKDMVRAYLNDLESMESDTPGADEPLTVAQAQHLVQTQVDAALTKERAERASQTYKAQVDQLGAQYRTEVDQSLAAAVAAHPILRDAVDGVEVLLLADIAPRVVELIQANPEIPVDLNEVKQMISEAAAKRAERFKALTLNATKQAAVDAARLRKTSPAPAGGAAPSQRQAKPSSMKLGGKDLVNAAIADLQRSGARP